MTAAADRGTDNRRLLRKLGLVTLGAFAFCFALVPLYRIACEQVFGIRLDGRPVDAATGQALVVDTSRSVRVQFDATIHNEREWRFGPEQVELTVHPGETVEAWYVASNLTGDTLVGHAVPDVLPRPANPYFAKTECFCFTEQKFAPGETRRMPVRFFVSPDLPANVNTLTLTYTFYNNEQATRREQAALAQAATTPDPDPRG